MAKILYGVNGEGMGHAIRSKPILTHLSKKHKLLIVAGGKAFDYLNNHFPVKKIGYFNIIYKHGSVRRFMTFFNNLLKFPFIFLYNLKIYYQIFKFKPDIAISDFEPFSNYAASLLRIPRLSIDNQHIATRTKISFDKKWAFDYWITMIIIKAMILSANKYFVTSFFYPQIKKRNTELIPPVLRDEIFKAKPSRGKHILVYQTSPNEKLIEALKHIDDTFIVYGFNRYERLPNITLKKADETQFLKDLTSSRAVITNGGFTLIGEALYLKKPILSIPTKKQFEQILNAVYLEKLGYGRFAEEFNNHEIEIFLLNLERYRKKLESYKKENNDLLFKKIDDFINNYNIDSKI